MPASLYPAIACHPTWHTMRVHLGQRTCDGSVVAHNGWLPDERTGDLPSVQAILAQLPESTPAHRHAAEHRLASFRLHLHEDDKSVLTYALRAKDPSTPLDWVWLKEERDD